MPMYRGMGHLTEGAIVADNAFLKSEGDEEQTSIGAENPPVSIVRECISDGEGVVISSLTPR